MREHQHNREFCDFTGLQRAQPRQHDPPLAAVVLRHEKHDGKQKQRDPQHRPGQPVPDVVVHQAGRVHSQHAQRRKQQLRADVGVGVAAAVECHRVPRGEQHDEPIAQQQQQDQQKRYVECRQRCRPRPNPLYKCSHNKAPCAECTQGAAGLCFCQRFKSRLSIV